MPEGSVSYRGFATWYREEGETEPGKLPVLCLHGGPGIAHDYLEGACGPTCSATFGAHATSSSHIGCRPNA